MTKKKVTEPSGQELQSGRLSIARYTGLAYQPTETGSALAKGMAG